MATSILAPLQQFLTSGGDLASGYQLFVYEGGTTTKAAIYSTAADADGATNALDNPLTLNARGEPASGGNGLSLYVADDVESVKITLALPTDDDPPNSPIRVEDNIGVGVNGLGYMGRTLAEKLGDVVNIKDFGAVCDGSTDDTDAVQDAIENTGSGVPVRVSFPPGATVYIAGTVYVPPLCEIDLQLAIVKGDGTNTVFETGYWSGGAVVSNHGQANETQICYKSAIRNGHAQDCEIFANLFNFCEGSVIENIRGDGCNQLLYANRCFYGTFNGLFARNPADPSALPAYHFDDAINAVGIRNCFAVDYDLGWKFSGSKDNPVMVNCGAESCTTGVSVEDATSAIAFLGWYFEDITTALSFNAGGNHSNVFVDHTWFNTTTTAISGTTILSGEWGLNNRRGSAAISLGTNFANRFKVRIPTDMVSNNTSTPALPAGITLGDACDADYINAIYDSGTGLVTNKLMIPSGKIPFYASGSIGLPVAATVPGASITLAAATVTVDTKINATNLEMVRYHLQVVDGGGTSQLAGDVVFMTAVPLTGFSSYTVTASNNGGYLRLVVSGLSTPTSCIGIVRHL